MRFVISRRWCETLANGIDFVRVDLYAVDGERVVLGEMTLNPGGGLRAFTPQAYDHEFGRLWRLES